MSVRLPVCFLKLRRSQRATHTQLVKGWSALVYEELCQSRTLLVRVAGLEIMNDDPSEVRLCVTCTLLVT